MPINMAYIESPHPIGPYDKALGILGVGLSEVFLQIVDYQNLKNTRLANEALASGHSVLLVSDHPGTVETIHTTGYMRKLTSRKKTAVIIKDDFINGRMALGRLAVDTLRQYGVESLDVKTPKYEPDEDVRSNYNKRSLKRAVEILEQPGGLLLLFSTGTRESIMSEAEEGIKLLSTKADIVVPLTTVVHGFSRPAIRVNEPIPGKPLVKWCIDNLGKESGRQAYSDLVMVLIASGQPFAEKRGFYRSMTEDLEAYVSDPFKSNYKYMPPRMKNLIAANNSWKQGEYNKSNGI